MKKIFICILTSLLCYNVYAADIKVSDLSSVTPVVADTVYVVDATDTSSKKATIGAVFNSANDLDSNGDVANDSHDHTTTTLSGIVLADDLDTFSSTNLRERLTDETGTGVAVFGTSPIFTTGITVPNDSISAAELNEGDNFTWTGSQNFNSATVSGVLTGETDTLANVVSRGSSAGGDMSASNITIVGVASSVRMVTGVGLVDGNLEISGEASAVNLTATNKVTTVTFRATTDASSPILEATTRLDIGSGNNATLQLDGSDNLVITDTVTGSKTLAELAAGSVAGSNTQIQFNDSGSLGGDANFTWDKNLNQLSASGPVLIAGEASAVSLRTNTTLTFATQELNDNKVKRIATGFINLGVQAAKLPIINPAGIDAGEENWRLLFDDGDTAEGALWQFRVPFDYDTASSPPILKIGYTMTSATSGSVKFESAMMAISDNESIDIGSYDASNVVIQAVPSTSGNFKEASMLLTNNDVMSPGDFVMIKLSTDADDAENEKQQMPPLLLKQDHLHLIG